MRRDANDNSVVAPGGEGMEDEWIHSLGPPLGGRNGRRAAKSNPGGAPAWGAGKEWERKGFNFWGRPWWEGMGGGLTKGILGVPLGGRNGRGMYSISGAAPGAGRNGRRAAEGNPGGAPGG
jgi:hypothetical protein